MDGCFMFSGCRLPRLVHAAAFKNKPILALKFVFGASIVLPVKHFLAMQGAKLCSLIFCASLGCPQLWR